MQTCLFPILVLLSSQLSVVYSALPPQMLELVAKQMKSGCVKKSGVDLEVLARIKDGDFAEDPKLKCYMNCCLNFSKVQTASNAAINEDAALKAIKKNMPAARGAAMIQQLTACKAVDGADACDVAFNYVKCAYGVNPNQAVVPN